MQHVPSHCVRCGETTTVRPCSACGQEPLLAERYALLEPIGRGGSGLSFRGLDLQGDEPVAIKETLLPGAEPKRRQLAEREAKVLSQLRHPAIPRYRHHEVLRQGRHEALYLVQDFVEGESLEQERRARRYTWREVAALLQELTGVLAYLHSLSPPVIHRDLKPSNLMRRPSGALALIDFGAVRDALRTHELGGSTVAGTFGFMAPEQLVGDASPRSDLYALGMLGAVLLTGKAPAELTERSGRPAWRRHARVPERLAQLIDGLLQADPDLRPRDARSVGSRLGALLQEAAELAEAPAPPRLPLVPAEASPLFEALPMGRPPRSATLLGQTSAEDAQLDDAEALAELAPVAPWRGALAAPARLLSAVATLAGGVAPLATIVSVVTGSEALFWCLGAWFLAQPLSEQLEALAKRIEQGPPARSAQGGPLLPRLLRVTGMASLGILGVLAGISSFVLGLLILYTLFMSGRVEPMSLLWNLGSAAVCALSLQGFKVLDQQEPGEPGPHRSLRLTSTVSRPPREGAQRSTFGGLALGATWGAMVASGLFAGMAALFALAMYHAADTSLMATLSLVALLQGGAGLGLWRLHDRLLSRWQEREITNVVGALAGISALILLTSLLSIGIKMI